MIRMIRRRLIIPCGDTGSFSIPSQATIGVTDKIIFAIFDPMTKQTVLEKEGTVDNNNVITISFAHEDTMKLIPKKYLWDIRIYKGPQYDEDDEIIDWDEVDSYYAAFSLPVCEIREVARNA